MSKSEGKHSYGSTLDKLVKKAGFKMININSLIL